MIKYLCIIVVIPVISSLMGLHGVPWYVAFPVIAIMLCLAGYITMTGGRP